MAFMRKLANKLSELSKKNEEVQNFLESIPEWAEFYTNVLTEINNIETRPLGSDPRKREAPKSDDYFDLKFKRIDNKFKNLEKIFGSSDKNKNNNDDEEEEEEPDMTNDNDNDDKNNNNNNEENQN